MAVAGDDLSCGHRLKAKTLADFIRFGLTDGQKDAAGLDYAPLPPALAARLLTRADSIAPPSTATK